MLSPTARRRGKQSSTGRGTEIRRHLRCIIQRDTSDLNIFRLCRAVGRMTRGRHLSRSTCNIPLYSVPLRACTILPNLFTLSKLALMASRNITHTQRNNQKQLMRLQQVAQLQPTTLSYCIVVRCDRHRTTVIGRSTHGSVCKVRAPQSCKAANYLYDDSLMINFSCCVF